MNKFILTLLAGISFALLIILTGISTQQHQDINDLTEQISELQEQLDNQERYIEEVHGYINEYTFENSGRVFIYTDDEGNYYD